MNIFLFILVGIVGGMASGFLGIGGGLVMVPAMIYFFDFSQRLAQGTSLAVLLPPVGFLAVLTYWQQGNIHVKAALWICLGFILGGLIGARAAHMLPSQVLRRAFGVFLFFISLHMIFKK